MSLGYKKDFIILPVFLIVYLIIASNIFTGFFIWDDKEFLLDPIVRGSDWLSILTGSHYSLFHPLTTTFAKLNYLIHANNPVILHWENLLLHCINSLLVFQILKKLNFHGYLGFIAFLFHPLSSEVAFWITSIKDLIFCFFGLLSILMYLRYLRDTKKNRYLYLSFIAVILALLSKVQAVFLPLILLGLDYYIKRSITLKDVLGKLIPILLGLGLIWINIRFRESESELISLSETSILDRIALSSKVFFDYTVSVLFPLKQSIFYPFETTTGPSPLYLVFPIIYFFTIIFLLTKGNIHFGTVMILFATSLLPVLQIIPIGESIRNDRYTYFSIFALALLLEICYRKSTEYSKALRNFTLLILSIYLAGIFYLNTDRAKIWSKPKQVFLSSIENYPDSEILLNTTGVIFLKENDKSNALKYFNKAIQSDPTYAQAYYNKGLLFEKYDSVSSAIQEYKKALDIHKEYPEAMFRLANLYYLRSENDSAHSLVLNLVKLAPRNAQGWDLLGKTEHQSGNFEQAILAYQKAISIDKDNVLYLYNLAVSLGMTGQYHKAIQILNNCITLDTSFHDAYYLRGLTKNIIGLEGCDDLQTAYLKGNQRANSAMQSFCN